MHTIEVNKFANGRRNVFTYSAPSAWNELSQEDLLIIASAASENISTLQAEIFIALQLFKIKRKQFRLLTSEHRAAIVELVRWIETERVIDKNIIPHFRHRWKKYHGPNVEYDNITGNEFMFAENAFIKYHQSRDPQYLDELVAILYRPHRKGEIINDIRADCTIYSIIERGKTFKSLSLELKTAIFLNYQGWRNWLIDEYSVIFPKNASTDNEDQEEPAEPESPVSMWDLTWRKLAESGTFGTYQQVGKTDIIVLFVHLTEKILEARKLAQERSKGR